MSAERIYNLIEEQQREDGSDERSEGKNQQGDGSSDDGGNLSAPSTPGGIGQVLDAPEQEGEGRTVAEQARDWQIAVEQAENVAKLAGKLPAGVHRWA